MLWLSKYNGVPKVAFADGYTEKKIFVTTFASSPTFDNQFRRSLGSDCAQDPYSYGSIFTDIFAKYNIEYSKKYCYK